MRAGRSNIEEFLGAILHGAAKILGCSSTNLILINERTHQIRVQIGAMAVSYPLLAEIEQVLGNSFDGISLPIENAQDSLIYRAWRDHATFETSSLPTLIGSAFQHEAVEQVSQLIGDLRFICVPALSGTRNYGVLLFTKEGKHPFSRQQREVLLRYARRIGEILENDLMGQGLNLFAQSSGPEYLLFDETGETIGHGPPGSTTGRVIHKLVCPDDPDRFRERVKELLGNAEGPRPHRIEPSPGLVLELSRFSLGGRGCLLCAVHRFEGRRTETSLENQLLQLTLGDTAPALFLDPEFNITSCNLPTEQLLGYSAAELLNQPVSPLFREPQEILDILGHQILNPANPYCEESAVIVHKDGSMAPARVEALVLADDQHQVVGFLLLVRESAEVPQDTAGRLIVQEQLATMGEMATQLAHEIRNPLVAIGATIDSLSREDLPADKREILAALSHEITRMDLILRDYLAVRHDVSFIEVSLAEVMQDILRLLDGARKGAGKTISAAIDPELKVFADYDAIKHIIFNLLLNALEASPDGSEVTCRAAAGKHDVSVTIEDRGPGLAASPEECFQPFFTTKPNGTGLGLAVCQKIARAHGGLVQLGNREGGGCQAVLILPRRSRRTQP